MKITPTSAMRARDVSRPRAEHLAAAAEREEAVTRHRDSKPDAVTATGALSRPVPHPSAPASAVSRSAPPTHTLPTHAMPPRAVPPEDVISPTAPPAAGEPAAGVSVTGSEPTTARRRRQRER
jgi:hypothetical protein